MSATTASPRPALSQLGTLELTVREGRIQQLAMLLEPRLAAAACAPLPGLKCKSTLLHVACDLGQTTCAQLLVKWAPAMQHATRGLTAGDTKSFMKRLLGIGRQRDACAV